jgi:hypothetical protein
MQLVPEGTRFVMLRHMLADPLHLVIMVGTMLAVMVAVMMVLR